MQEASHMWYKDTGEASPSCLTSVPHLGSQCGCHLLSEASLGLSPLDIALIRVHQQNKTRKRQTMDYTWRQTKTKTKQKQKKRVDIEGG